MCAYVFTNTHTCILHYIEETISYVKCVYMCSQINTHPHIFYIILKLVSKNVCICIHKRTYITHTHVHYINLKTLLVIINVFLCIYKHTHTHTHKYILHYIEDTIS
jgi:hypothetical protein